MIRFIFWFSAGAILYPYFIYPLFLFFISIFRKGNFKNEIVPFVSLLIVAYNEEGVIKDKLENSLSLDYPKEKLEIIVASDASTDGTDKIVETFSNRRVRLISSPSRGSQTGAQNYAAPQAVGEIIIFSDANSFYEKDAIKKLVRNFADSNVGCVVGRLAHIIKSSSSVSSGESLYWKYESVLKRIQSKAKALLFANGAIYAVRKCLYSPIYYKYDHDTMVPLNCILQKKKVVYEPEAIASEESPRDYLDELRRKVRIIVRDAWTFTGLKFMLFPPKPWIAFNIFSHKIIRWCVGIFMLALFISNGFMLKNSFYHLFFYLQVLFYSVALLVYFTEKKSITVPVFMRIPFFFCLVNLAGLLAFCKIIKGEEMHLWNPRSW